MKGECPLHHRAVGVLEDCYLGKQCEYTLQPVFQKKKVSFFWKMRVIYLFA